MKLKSENWLIFALVLLGIHLLLFNFNVTEWGDTFSFLRIADFLTRGDYPLDAKRLPVFPLLLAGGMRFSVEPIFWGRLLVFFFSAGCFFLFLKLLKILFPTISEKQQLLAGYFLLFNPIFLYWSVRVLSEAPFCFFVLLTFYLYYTRKSVVLLGVVAGLAAMTRYEGFLLFPAIALGLVLSKKFKSFVLYSLVLILLVSPWFWRNHLTFGKIFYTPYASDQAGFLWSLKDKATFFFHLLFSSGFCLGAIPIVSGLRKLWLERRKDLLPLGIFLGLSLLLIFVWSSVARMFFTTIPLVTVLLALGRDGFSKLKWSKLVSFSVPLLGIYAAGAYFLRPYFVAPSKMGAGLVLVSAVLVLGLFWPKKFLWLWEPVILAGLILLSGLVVFKHRNVYADVYQAVQKGRLLSGKIAYFDETGLSQWYFRKNGIYFNEYLESEEQRLWLRDNKIDFVFWTTAHNEGPALTVINEPTFANRFELLSEFQNPEFASESRIYKVRNE